MAGAIVSIIATASVALAVIGFLTIRFQAKARNAHKASSALRDQPVEHSLDMPSPVLHINSDLVRIDRARRRAELTSKVWSYIKKNSKNQVIVGKMGTTLATGKKDPEVIVIPTDLKKGQN